MHGREWMSAIIYCKILSEHHLEVHAPGIRFARQDGRLPLETLRGLIYLPAFLDTGFPEGMCANGTQVPCEVPSLPNPITRQGWPHYRGLRPPLFSNSDVGSFTSHNNKSVKVLWDGTYGFSSLSETTRKSNHLQMSLQRQYFLLSYLKTLSVGPAGVWTCDLPLGRPALFQLS